MSTEQEKAFEKKIRSKEFLRRNEFLESVSGVVEFVSQNKPVAIGLGIALIGLVAFKPVLNWQKQKKSEAFSLAYDEASASLKKSKLYEDLLKNYSDLPAHQMARLKLVGEKLEANETEAALKLIDEGLAVADQGVFSSLLLLKKINILKSQNEFQAAYDALEAGRVKTLSTFQLHLDFMSGDLLMLMDQKDKARAVYEKIVKTPKPESLTDPNYDPQVVQQAKDKVLLLDLGVL